MHKSLFRWRMRFTLALICLLLAFNVVGIQAQDITPTPETPTASPEPTETTPPPLPSEEPTETPPVVATEEPTETAVPTEVVTEPPVATEVPTEVVTEPPVTEAPVETPAPVAWSILAREQFNTADLSAWISGAGWSIVISSPADPNYPISAPDVDQVLQVVNSNESIQYGTLAYSNVSVEASFLATAGSAQVSIRQSATDPNANYTAAIDATGLVQLYRSGVAVVPPIQAAATQDNWHVLQLSANGNVVTLTVDKVQTVSWTDTEPLAAGFITLSGEFGDTAAAVDPAANVVKADNFFVYVPDAEKALYPTPTPATPVPTEAPTETPVEIVPTEEVTSPPTEPPTIGGKSMEPYAPPTEEQLIGALASDNDLFADAELVTLVGGYSVDTGSTTADTTEVSETQLCGFNIAKTIWYELTVPAGSYTFSTVGSNFDTIISVYKGATLATLIPGGATAAASCNDDISTTVLQSQITMSLAAGTYFIQVGGFNGAWGNYAFRVQQGAIAAPVAPVLTTPTAGIVLNDSTPTLNWNASANGYRYEVQIATLATFTPASLIVNLDVGVGILSYTPAPLPSPATYYWRVRALNINGVAGPYSGNRAIVYRTAPPVVNLPADNATTTDTTPTFTWATFGAGAKYQIQVDDDPGFGTALFTQGDIVPLTYTRPAAIPQGVWYWHVRATDVQSNNTDYSAYRTLTINIQSAPADNAVVSLVGAAVTANVNFTWVAVPGATSYSLEYSTSNTFPGTAETTEITGIATTSRSVALPAGIYYWHVRAVGVDADYPAFYRTVTVSPPTPAIPVLVAPAASAVTIDTTPDLDWNDTTTVAGNPFEYDVQICPTAACAAPIALTGATDLPTSAYTVNPALAPGAWYWRVRVRNNLNVNSAYSAARLFTVKSDILSTPANNFVSADTTPGFAWTVINYPNITPPVKYRLQIADDIAFGGGDIVFVKADLTTLNYMMTAPADPALANGTYYWRVSVDTGTGAGYEVASVPRKIIISPSVPVAPTYLPAPAPAAGATFWDTTPLLDFNNVTPPPTAPWVVEFYEVQIGSTAAFTTILQSSNTLPTSQYQATALGAGTYYWRARAINDFGAPGAFSAARSFIIRTTVPLLTAPADNAFVTTSKPVFSWPTFGVGAKYNLEIAENAAFNVGQQSFNNIAALTFTPPTSLKQGVWFWRIRAVDALGTISTESLTRSFTIRILSAPADNAVVTLVGAAPTANVTFSWVAVPGATGYTVKVDDNPAFSTPTDYFPATPTGLSKLQALPPDEYWWYVVPTGFAPNTPPAAAIVRKVTVSPTAPVVPVLLLPAAGASTTDTTPQFTWNATTTVNGAPFTYEIQVATASTFAPAALVALTPATTGLALTYTPTSALTPGLYYWRVRAVNQFGVASAYSASTRSFTVDTVATPLPLLTVPVNKSTSTNKLPTFTWTKPTGAVRFELRYSINYPAGYVSGDILNTVGTVIIGNQTVTPSAPLLTATTYKHPSPLLPNRYYWQVQAFDAAGNGSGWTNLFTFVITSALTDTPIPNHYGPGDPILLTWGPLSWVTPGAGYYEVQVDNNSTFASPEYQRVGTPSATGGIDNAAYILGPYGVVVPDSSTPGGLPNGTWYWRVRGFNPTVLPSGAFGAYSTTGTFTVEK